MAGLSVKHDNYCGGDTVVSTIRIKLENLLKHDTKFPRNAKSQLHGRRIFPLLNRDDGLARRPDPFAKLFLGQVRPRQPDAANIIEDFPLGYFAFFTHYY